MTLPACTVCGSADVMSGKAGTGGEQFDDLFFYRLRTPDIGCCEQHWMARFGVSQPDPSAAVPAHSPE